MHLKIRSSLKYELLIFLFFRTFSVSFKLEIISRYISNYLIKIKLKKVGDENCLLNFIKFFTLFINPFCSFCFSPLGAAILLLTPCSTVSDVHGSEFLCDTTTCEVLTVGTSSAFAETLANNENAVSIMILETLYLDTIILHSKKISALQHDIIVT